MVEANLRIIEELRAFLDMVCDKRGPKDAVVRNPSDFSRDRKLTLRRVAGMMINMPKRSLAIELQEFFDGLDIDGAAASKGAFSQQRGKLLPFFFEVWNRLLVDCFYHYYGERAERWRGFRVQAVDGSTAYLVDTPDVVAGFGTQANQCKEVPMARVVQVQDVLNGITVWGGIFPIKEGEQAIMASRAPYLYADSLTLFDRGYPSYALMYLLMNEETPRRFVMRCRADFNEKVREFLKSGRESEIAELRPGPQAIATLKDHGYVVDGDTTIRVRMARVVLSTGGIEILPTNLYDGELYSAKDFKYLYGLRWRIETTYGTQKNQQQMEQFSGHRAICIRQDYLAGLFTANLQCLVEKQCASYLQRINATRKYDYKINRNISWACLKHDIAKLFLRNDPESVLTELQKAFQRNVEPVRPGRHYERHRKMRRTKGKYQTLTNYRRAI